MILEHRDTKGGNMTLLEIVSEQMKELSKGNAEIVQELKEVLRKHPPMTPEERRTQVLDYCFGHLPEGSTLSRDQLAKIIFRYEEHAE